MLVSMQVHTYCCFLACNSLPLVLIIVMLQYNVNGLKVKEGKLFTACFYSIHTTTMLLRCFVLQIYVWLMEMIVQENCNF